VGQFDAELTEHNRIGMRVKHIVSLDRIFETVLVVCRLRDDTCAEMIRRVTRLQYLTSHHNVLTTQIGAGQQGNPKELLFLLSAPRGIAGVVRCIRIVFVATVRFLGLQRCKRPLELGDLGLDVFELFGLCFAASFCVGFSNLALATFRLVLPAGIDYSLSIFSRQLLQIGVKTGPNTTIWHVDPLAFAAPVLAPPPQICFAAGPGFVAAILRDDCKLSSSDTCAAKWFAH
jgi:hypothetical protein